MEIKSFGVWLREQRESRLGRKVTMEELAKNIGVKGKQFIHQFESDRRIPPIASLFQFCKFLGIPISEVVQILKDTGHEDKATQIENIKNIVLNESDPFIDRKWDFLGFYIDAASKDESYEWNANNVKAAYYLIDELEETFGRVKSPVDFWSKLARAYQRLNQILNDKEITDAITYNLAKEFSESFEKFRDRRLFGPKLREENK